MRLTKNHSNKVKGEKKRIDFLRIFLSYMTVAQLIVFYNQINIYQRVCKTIHIIFLEINISRELWQSISFFECNKCIIIKECKCLFKIFLQHHLDIDRMLKWRRTMLLLLLRNTRMLVKCLF